MEGFGDIQRILENQFQFSFRTGNVIIDTMIAGMLITTTTYLFSMIRKLCINYEFLVSLVGIRYNKIIISGKLVKKNPKNEIEEADFSIKFKAILHQIRKAGYSKSGVHQLVEPENTHPDSEELVVAQTTSFNLSPDIFCKIVQEAKKDTYFRDSEADPSFKAELSSKDRVVEDLEKLLKSWIKEYELFNQESGDNMIELTGTFINGFNQSFNFSNRFLAVLHKMRTLNFNLPHIKKLREVQLEEPVDRYGSNDSQQDEKRKAENLVPEVCQIAKDISCKVEWTKNKNDTLEYSIKITSEVLNVQELSEILRTWEKEYDEHNQVGDGLKYFVFNHSENNTGQLPYTEFCFESVKSFKNVFFPEKDSLIEKIKFFQENESWFTERGIPYMLGLLLHGEPGCGKTSTIKAIANLTRRHIVSVPLKNVRSVAELYNVFYGTKVNNRVIPMDKRLYVLEDIDCGGLENIVRKRKRRNMEAFDNNEEENEEENECNKSIDSGNEDIISENEGEKKIRKTIKEELYKKELTLSDLLEVFDGVMESKGRMMVITTNHLDKLDPALIRPGRVDTCLQFRKCEPAAIMSIFYTFYGKKGLPEGFDIQQVPGNTWTPAEIVQIFVNHCTQPGQGLSTVCAKVSQS